MRRLGFFGGSFSPLHNGHLILAQEIRELAKLEQVAFLPLHAPSHKPQAELLPWSLRLSMLERAIGGIPGLTVDARDLRRGGTTYTVDSLHEIHQEFPNDEIFFLIGEDSLADLPRWKSAKELAVLATFLAAPRPDSKPGALETALAAGFRAEIIPTTKVDISSRAIRARMRSGLSLRGYVPEGVEELLSRYAREIGRAEPPSSSGTTP